MKDVAAAAGVSVPTVSLALRNHPSIAAGTRQRVRAAARRLGYQPNPLVAALMSVRARGKRSTRNLTIACLVVDQGESSWDQQQVYRQMRLGAQQRAEEAGYHLETFRLGGPEMTPRRLRQILRARSIPAILVAPLPGDLTRLDFDFSDFAVVGLGMSVVEPSVERVANDHFQSAVLAFRRGTELGYRRIGFVLSQKVNTRLDERWLAGYYLAQREVPAARQLPPLLPPTSADVAGALPAWIRRTRPDLIITGEARRDLPAALPAQTAWALLSREEEHPELAGIDQDSPAVGAIAIDHLLARLHRSEFGPAAQPRLHLIAGRWVDGASAPPVRPTDARAGTAAADRLRT